MADRRSDGLYMLTMCLLCVFFAVVGIVIGILISRHRYQDASLAGLNVSAKALTECQASLETSDRIIRAIFPTWKSQPPSKKGGEE